MANDSFYRTPYLTTVSFAVGILLFLLPFLEVKCNGASVAEISGKDMVIGSDPKMGKDLESFGKTIGGGGDVVKAANKPEGKGKVYVAAIVALALGVIGLIISLQKKGVNYSAMQIAGIVGAIALIVLIFQVKGDINSQMKSAPEKADPFSDQFSGMLKVSVDITAWFVICVLSYLAAAFFSRKQKALTSVGDIPPAAAPQLHIENPGDQSDFPAAPSGGKDLG